MINSKMESLDRPYSPDMYAIGEILLPQVLVDAILMDVVVDIRIGEAGVMGDKIVKEVEESDINCLVLRNETLEDLGVESGDGEFQYKVSSYDIGRVGNNEIEDYLDNVKTKETIDTTSSVMNGSQPVGVRKKRCGECLQQYHSEADPRKEKRKIANRISAAKSHASKQAQLKTTELKVTALKNGNLLKKKSLEFLIGLSEKSIARLQLRRTSSL